MKPIEGRLQTAEHIFFRILEIRFPDAKFIISKFEENSGKMEISTKEDQRKINRTTLQYNVNAVIKKNLHVTKHIMTREDAQKEFDLTRLPSSINKVRIVEIEGFDKTPCKDPHVENTSEIGYFEILKVKRVGKDRYRFTFYIE